MKRESDGSGDVETLPTQPKIVSWTHLNHEAGKDTRNLLYPVTIAYFPRRVRPLVPYLEISRRTLSEEMWTPSQYTSACLPPFVIFRATRFQFSAPILYFLTFHLRSVLSYEALLKDCNLATRVFCYHSNRAAVTNLATKPWVPAIMPIISSMVRFSSMKSRSISARCASQLSVGIAPIRMIK